MSSITNLSVQQLLKAAALKGKIAALETELAQLLGSAATGGAPAKSSHKMSAAGRARISAAAKLRWAKINALKGKAAAPAKKTMAAKPAKSKMSPATRAALSAKLKAFWAAKKAAKK